MFIIKDNYSESLATYFQWSEHNVLVHVDSEKSISKQIFWCPQQLVYNMLMHIVCSLKKNCRNPWIYSFLVTVMRINNLSLIRTQMTLTIQKSPYASHDTLNQMPRGVPLSHTSFSSSSSSSSSLTSSSVFSVYSSSCVH